MTRTPPLPSHGLGLSRIGGVKLEKRLQSPSGSASAKQNRMEKDQSMNMSLSMPNSLKFLIFITFIITSLEEETTPRIESVYLKSQI